MPKKLPPHKTAFELAATLDDPYFALSSDVDFASLISPLGTLPGGPYDYAYVTTNASTPGMISIGNDLEALSGIIATGNGKDKIDLSDSTGDNLVFAGNGVDIVTGGDGIDIIFAGNGKDTVNGGLGNDQIDGGQAKDILAGGEDDGTAVVTFEATDADDNPVLILPANSPVVADGVVLTGSVVATGNDLVEEEIFVDVTTAPDTIHHVFSFAPTDVGPLGGSTAFIVGVFDADGSLVDTFDVNMTEGVKNFFSLVDNDAVDDGGTVAVFSALTVVPGTLAAAEAIDLDAEAYQPVTLTPTSVEITAGDVLIGGGAKDTFVYNIGDGVDVIEDYQKGDVIELHGIDEADVTTIVEGGNTTLLFGDGEGGIAVDSAIQLVGYTSQVHLVFD